MYNNAINLKNTPKIDTRGGREVKQPNMQKRHPYGFDAIEKMRNRFEKVTTSQALASCAHTLHNFYRKAAASNRYCLEEDQPLEKIAVYREKLNR